MPTTSSLMIMLKQVCLVNRLNEKIYLLNSNARFAAYNGRMSSSPVANASVAHVWMALPELLLGSAKTYLRMLHALNNLV